MPVDDLTLFSYEILGLVGRQGASAPDLRQMARRGRILDRAGESQYYTEPKRPAGLGYLATRQEPGKTRKRTVYTLTAKAREALREGVQPVKKELLLRLLICDLVGEATTWASAATIREDIADLMARLDETERRTEALAHRRKYQLLVIGFLRRLLDLHLERVEDIERDLAPARSGRSAESESRG